jgi:hypothetical protein
MMSFVEVACFLLVNHIKRVFLRYRKHNRYTKDYIPIKCLYSGNKSILYRFLFWFCIWPYFKAETGRCQGFIPYSLLCLTDNKDIVDLTFYLFALRFSSSFILTLPPYLLVIFS